MRVSPETIYQALYVQSRGALPRDLAVGLRTGRALRRPVPQTRATQEPHFEHDPGAAIARRPIDVPTLLP